MKWDITEPVNNEYRRLKAKFPGITDEEIEDRMISYIEGEVLAGHRFLSGRSNYEIAEDIVARLLQNNSQDSALKTRATINSILTT